MNFHFNNWLVYFYFYCMFGWVFESTVVSVATKKWTNRGFMKGPWLPLYGTGALLVLFVTLPFQKYPLAVYFVGAIAATILEYITGVFMLKLFKVRYWDYSQNKFQFQGQICLKSSIAWGFLSILMVYVVQKPVAKFIGFWNEEFLSILTFIITIIIVFDFTSSFRDAMDLRTLIIEAEELKKRLNAALEEEKAHLNRVIEKKWAQFEQSVADAREQREEVRIDTLKRIEKRREEFSKYIEQIEMAVIERREWKEELSLERKEYIEEAIEEKIKELVAKREKLREKMEKYSKHLLLQNPSSSFRDLREESIEIKKRLLKRRRDKKWKKESNCKEKH